jgi:hypothetical protein
LNIVKEIKTGGKKKPERNGAGVHQGPRATCVTYGEGKEGDAVRGYTLHIKKEKNPSSDGWT